MANVNYKLFDSSRNIKIKTINDLEKLKELSLSEPGIINLDDEIFNLDRLSNIPPIRNMAKIIDSNRIHNKKIKKKIAKENKRLYNGVDTEILDII